MRLNQWLGLIFVIFGFIALLFIIQGIFKILAWVAPVLLLVTLIINYRVVTGYGKILFNLLKDSPLLGIGAVLLTIIGFPVVIALLFGMALMGRRFQSLQKKAEEAQLGEYVDYVEVEEEPREDFLQLPDLEKGEQPNEYEDFFNEDK